ncbi:glycosyltransferase [Microbacterium suaedae]|uniref:glycosyltransferase n=1 Tax=Microbacterium suaedae TaxID=2067813 RepID=UPI0013A609E7|nr:glycosyltransferase [Microbacterium suaedae]
MHQGPQVLVFPSWRDNPFLNLLALAARSQGRRFLGSTTYEGFREQIKRLHAGDTVHLHWTQPLLQKADSPVEAEGRLRALTADLDSLAARGISLVWTVHNRLPHELSYPQEERRLIRAIAKRADAIHIMAPATSEVVAEVVTIDPAKVRLIPHPSYEGVYDSGIDRSTARASFDLDSSDRAVLFLGQIRPYKGVDALIKASGTASLDDRNVVLMLAGAVKEIPLDEFQASLPDGIRTITDLSFIDDGDISRWFRAADVAVFPYRAILNSGSLHLAASFRTPVIFPDEPHLRSQFGKQTWVEFFDPARPAESIAELLSDPTLFSNVTDADFRSFTDPISPWAVSRQYAQLLDELSAGA